MSANSLTPEPDSLITPAQIAEHVGAHLDRSATPPATALAHMQLVLATARRQLEAGTEPAHVIGRLLPELHGMRRSYGQALWPKLVESAQRHPVLDLLLQDPFSSWSFRMPRGYSGDARLLDFVYGHPSVRHVVANASPLGRRIYDYTKEAASSVAVRERRVMLAEHVDRTADARGSGAEILAVAAGHLREAELSRAHAEDRLERWVALDQDPLSAAVMRQDLFGTAVEVVDGSVRDLLSDTLSLGTFDLVYAAGLYDYLPRAVAVRLTRRLVRMLKPGGTYLFANFAADMLEDAYREIVMNWTLLLRDESEMWDIVNASVDRNTVDARVWRGANGSVIYATLTRRDG